MKLKKLRLKKPRQKNVLQKFNANASSKHPGLTKPEPPGKPSRNAKRPSASSQGDSRRATKNA